MSGKGPKKPRFLYSRETLKEALAAIRAGMPINTASNKYHVPRSTLHSKINQKYADKRPGPDTVMTSNEENTLVQWIIDCNKLGIPVGKQHLLNSVALLVKTLNRENPFANGRPGRHWYQSFLKRHEDVVDKITENSCWSRAAMTEPVVRKWFSNTIPKLSNIHPSRIFATETLTLLSPEASDEKENLCVQITASATGQLIPPMLVLTYQRIPGKVSENLPRGWTCCKSENGYITFENFYDHISKSFHPWLLENNIEFPVILLLDGKVPHVTLSLSDFCARNRIELIALPPNSQDILQPFNAGLFAALKIAWQQALDKYREDTKAVNLLNEDIAPLINSIFSNIHVVNIVKNGFATCGLYPVSEKAINYNKIPERLINDKVQRERVEFTPYVPIVQTELRLRSKMTRDLLEFLEENINPITLQVFKHVNIDAEWTGRVEDASLFYLWRKAVNLCKSNEDSHEIYNDNLHNDGYNYNELDDIHFDMDDANRVKIENMNVIEDPLKLCITEMDDV